MNTDKMAHFFSFELFTYRIQRNPLLFFLMVICIMWQCGDANHSCWPQNERKNFIVPFFSHFYSYIHFIPSNYSTKFIDNPSLSSSSSPPHHYQTIVTISFFKSYCFFFLNFVICFSFLFKFHILSS